MLIAVVGKKYFQNEWSYQILSGRDFTQYMIPKYFLDILCAFLQLINEPEELADSEDLHGQLEWLLAKYPTRDIHNSNCASLPVSTLIETLMFLIQPRSPTPPLWLRKACRDMLTRTILRHGGLSEVLTRTLTSQKAQGKFR